MQPRVESQRPFVRQCGRSGNVRANQLKASQLGRLVNSMDRLDRPDMLTRANLSLVIFNLAIFTQGSFNQGSTVCLLGSDPHTCSIEHLFP